MRETEEASKLSKMNDIGQIRGCIADGPLSFDLVINKKVTKYKNMDKRKIKGDADIILFPNIYSANIAYNIMIHALKAKSATLLPGTTALCIFNSRSGNMDSKFYSIILAIFYSVFLHEEQEK